MENSEKFRQRGEATVMQYVNRRGVMKSKYLAAATSSNYQASSPPPTTNFEGDISMGGMKFDLNALATLVAKANASSAGKPGKGPKIAAPWRTVSEVAELREKKLCLRCKKTWVSVAILPGLWPSSSPTQVNNLQNTFSAIMDDSASDSEKD
ncbi:hypothetical protein K3495_g2829 [Podosphaera aphanis]|nr:hypothetical protein K3495_g2829 [Podosphaera aphanis]